MKPAPEYAPAEVRGGPSSLPADIPTAEPVTGFPVSGTPARAGQGAVGVWSSGLCDCCDDCGLCCITCWCPPITFAKVAEIVDKGSPPGATGRATLRAKLRAQYGLPDVPCGDCCVSCCCEPCALCQEYRELKARGFDPEIGWQLNVQRGNAGVGNAPGVQQMGR
ncbi:unnamed protein product [Alopecurus aequalis]